MVRLVHRENLLARGCSEDFDDRHKLVDTARARKEHLARDELGEDAADRPHVDGDCSKDFTGELGLVGHDFMRVGD